ncbi:MAG: hypothetical protein QMD46_09685 [Methanomicrobiales archaeon]|nr:hypothetical protein [Methanomicrobiales archaeon]MDI6877361.1 hypothetical protein [Methanomicrobiales archaeon]
MTAADDLQYVRSTGDLRSTFREEARSFFILSLMNIVFAALAMAFGISAVVVNIPQLADGGGILPLVSLLLGGIAAAVGIWWLAGSAGILGDVDDLRDEARALQESDEEILRLMIGMMALYRERRPTVRRMILVSRIGGAIFLFLGVVRAIQLAGLAGSMGGALETYAVYLGIGGVIVTAGMAAAALLVSILFARYAAAWEGRLEETARAEGALKSTLERD